MKYPLAIVVLLSACQAQYDNTPTNIGASNNNNQSLNGIDDNDSINNNTDLGSDSQNVTSPNDLDNQPSNNDDVLINENQPSDKEETSKDYAIQSVSKNNLCFSLDGTKLVTDDCSNVEQRWVINQSKLSPKNQPNLCVDHTLTLSQCQLEMHFEVPLLDRFVMFTYQSNAIDLNVNNDELLSYPVHGGSNQKWQLVDDVLFVQTNNPETVEPEENMVLPEVEEEQANNTETEDDLINQIETRMSCGKNPTIEALNANEMRVARNGSLFSKTLYNPDDKTQNNNTHQPFTLKLKVTENGNPVEGCEIHFDNNKENGWAFSDQSSTNNLGELDAWWTAGHADNQIMKASIVNDEQQESAVEFSGTAYGHSTRSNSIHINWQSDVWDHFMVDVTPLTLPQTTYYSAINFPGGYTGLQTSKILFSVWDVNGIDAQIVDPGIATCTGFGGEGTGAKCYIDYAPVINQDYRFEVLASYPVANRTDYTMYFTDITDGSRIHFATLRYGKVEQPRGAAGFVEDWWEAQESCLLNNERSVYFGNVKYKQGNDEFTEIKQARMTGVYNQWHNEICSNYYFGVENGKFKWSSGGDQLISPPTSHGNFNHTATIE